MNEHFIGRTVRALRDHKEDGCALIRKGEEYVIRAVDEYGRPILNVDRLGDTNGWYMTDLLAFVDEEIAQQSDEDQEYDPTPAQCCECEEPAVGYSEGEAYCTAHYRSRPRIA